MKAPPSLPEPPRKAWRVGRPDYSAAVRLRIREKSSLRNVVCSVD